MRALAAWSRVDGNAARCVAAPSLNALSKFLSAAPVALERGAGVTLHAQRNDAPLLCHPSFATDAAASLEPRMHSLATPRVYRHRKRGSTLSDPSSSASHRPACTRRSGLRCWSSLSWWRRMTQCEGAVAAATCARVEARRLGCTVRAARRHACGSSLPGRLCALCCGPCAADLLRPMHGRFGTVRRAYSGRLLSARTLMKMPTSAL